MLILDSFSMEFEVVSVFCELGSTFTNVMYV